MYCLLRVLVRKTEKKLSSHYIQIYPANVLLCYVKSIPLSQLRLSNFELLQWKRRKTIRSGGGIQHFQVDFKFWHYTTSKFDLQAYRQKHMKLFVNIVLKRKFLRPSNTPEAQKERSCQSYSSSHITWRAECSFHRPTFIRLSHIVQ